MRGYNTAYRDYRYHLQDCRSKGNARGIFNLAYSSLRNIMERCFAVLKVCIPILKMIASYSLQTQVLILTAVVTLHNYIRYEAQRDRLFEKYGNDVLIVIDSDDENEEDEALTGFNSSHLISEMDWFRDGLVSLI